MSGGRSSVDGSVIEIGKDTEDKTRREAVNDLFLFKSGRCLAMRIWRDQRKAAASASGEGFSAA
jgi:hypothetical protein